MAKQPEHRYPSAGALAAAARTALTSAGTLPRAPGDDFHRQASAPTVIPPPIPSTVIPTPEWTKEEYRATTTRDDEHFPRAQRGGHTRRAHYRIGLAVLASLVIFSLVIVLAVLTTRPKTTGPRVIATIPVGAWEVAVTPDGRHAYVTGPNVAVVDTVSNTVTATIPMASSWGIAVTPDGRGVYIANSTSGTVSVIDTASNTVTATIPVDGTPLEVAVTPDGGRAYVTNSRSGTVSVIDTKNNNVIASIPASGTLTLGGGVAVTPDSRHVYITNTGASSVSVIDTTSNMVTATIPVSGSPEAAAVTPDGGHVYVTGASSVSIIDTAINKVTATIPAARGARGLALAPDGGHAYVTNFLPDTVSVIDTKKIWSPPRSKLGEVLTGLR